MKLEFAPLLQAQRELYGMPRGGERFRAYLAAMIDPETRDLKLPLSGMNPMGKDHVPALLDQYIALDAEAVALRAMADAKSRLDSAQAESGQAEFKQAEFKVALVLSDDAMGQWTNRYTSEFNRRFGTRAHHRRGWIEVGLWTSETPSAKLVREETLSAIYRAAYIERHGFASALRQMMAQEAFAMAMAGCDKPALDADEISYTREIIEPHLDTKDYPTIIACLFGDEAAHCLGYQPMGLGERAGLALALGDGQIEFAASG
jgi:hypothetical protein